MLLVINHENRTAPGYLSFIQRTAWFKTWRLSV